MPATRSMVWGGWQIRVAAHEAATGDTGDQGECCCAVCPGACSRPSATWGGACRWAKSQVVISLCPEVSQRSSLTTAVDWPGFDSGGQEGGGDTRSPAVPAVQWGALEEVQVVRVVDRPAPKPVTVMSRGLPHRK